MGNRKTIKDVSLIVRKRIDRDTGRERGDQVISDMAMASSLKSTDALLLHGNDGESKQIPATAFADVPGTIGGALENISSPHQFAHGFGQVPRLVLLTSKDSDGGNQYAEADATNITVTFSGAGTKSFWYYASI